MSMRFDTCTLRMACVHTTGYGKVDFIHTLHLPKILLSVRNPIHLWSVMYTLLFIETALKLPRTPETQFNSSKVNIMDIYAHGVLFTHFGGTWVCHQSSWYAELMVCGPPSVVSYLRIYWADFLKLQLLNALAHTLRHWQKEAFTIFFLFSVFVNMRSYRRKKFKTLTIPQIAFEFFHNFSWIFFQWS